MPDRVRIANDGVSFVRGGRPFYMLADTCWRAFDGPTDEEWMAYLRYRQEQGYNTLQIMSLPWRFAHKADLPFHHRQDGSVDFMRPDPAYLARCERMLRAAAEMGFVPALVVLWGHYVPDTWNSMETEGWCMSQDEAVAWAETLARLAKPYAPIYLVSGDTDYGERSTPIYHAALQAVKRVDPEGLTTMHAFGGQVDVPEPIRSDPALDFYMLQSSHGRDVQDRAFTMCLEATALRPAKPIINGEPCYEGHQQGGGVTERFSAADVRRASWQSLLSGGSAGIAYGAHGIWSWHRHGQVFGNPKFGGSPYDWSTALRLMGGWDVAYSRWVFETFGLYGAQPADVVRRGPHGCCAASTDAWLAVYVPEALDLCLADADLSQDPRDWRMIRLWDRYAISPEVERGEDGWRVAQTEWNGDVLLLVKRV